jgi:hypothetical protein
MLKSAQLGKEIVVMVMNKIGVLADISEILADHGINILAVSGYAINNDATIMVVTEDNLRALDALKTAGYKGAKENTVIVLGLENEAGALSTVITKLASENIDIRYIYGTTCPDACPSRVILSTNNDEKALVAFKSNF